MKTRTGFVKRILPGKVIVHEGVNRNPFPESLSEGQEVGAVVAEFYGLRAIDNADAFIRAVADVRPRRKDQRRKLERAQQ